MVGVHPDGTALPVFINLPSIGSKIAEDVLGGDVMTVKAEAEGGTIEYSIVGGNINNAFDIDATGKLTVKGLIDYEEVPEYNLVLRATKSGVSPALVQETKVTIPIEDKNDNAPIFNARGSSVEVEIQTNADVGLLASMVC